VRLSLGLIDSLKKLGAPEPALSLPKGLAFETWETTNPNPRSKESTMFHTTEDLRIQLTKVLLPPVFLEEERPVSEAASDTIFNARNEISDILNGRDSWLLTLVGPCSIHDPKAAREYAGLLKAAIEEFSADLRIVMRVYFEKPRTTIGWKGLINDPHLDQSYKINDGLRQARNLLLDLAELGVPTGTEFLDVISPQYIAGLVSWGAIGARTTESQVHRQLVSGVSCPVGFKNGTSGNVQIAIDAILSAAHSHAFLGLTKTGQSAILITKGNPDTHIILRGGRGTVNYTAESVAETAAQMEKASLPPRIMIDFSHANSGKDYRRQSIVCHDVAAQIAAGDKRILGVMIESNLVAGAQQLVAGQPLDALVYGQSITDACIDWAETRALLAELAAAVRARRG
jgi:3-deoxy-7-phosphoheptulonate synthase